MNPLNPDLDASALARQFAVDGRLRVADLLQEDFAERLRKACQGKVPYRYLCHVDGQNLSIPPAELAAMGQPAQQDLQAKIVANAAEGVGFFYSGYQMRRADPATSDPDLALLREMVEFLNSDAMLALIATITGETGLAGADAQYTRYTPGQFLTRHKDDITREGRRIAYVLGLTKGWHPDWGGLLQFFADDGTPRDAWVPTFNTISLFHVRHVHSVTYVTPFAKEARLSLTGWFHTAIHD